MGDRGEQRGPRLVGLGVEPREVHLRVEPGALQRDRDLPRGRLEQPQVLAADRRLALGADHDQGPEHLAADVKREPAFLARRRVLAGLDDLVRAAPRPRSDLAPREVQRAEQRSGEVLQDAFEALARQDLGGQVAQQPRLALALSRPRPLLERPGDERAHDRRDHEERDQRDRVLGVGDAQRVQRLGEEVVDAQQAEDRRDQAAPQAADRRGDDDAEQVDRDRPELPPRLQDEAETRRDGGREQGGAHRPHLGGSLQVPEHAHTLNATAWLRVLHALGGRFHTTFTHAGARSEGEHPPASRDHPATPDRAGSRAAARHPPARAAVARRGRRAPAARNGSRAQAGVPRAGAPDRAAQARAARQAHGPRGVRPDNMSSVAYATEEILKVRSRPSVCSPSRSSCRSRSAILAVLAILLFSYRQTIKAYPSAGGAYIVTKDNFGLLTAPARRRRAAHRLRPDGTVSVAAGVEAISSAAPGLYATASRSRSRSSG